MKYVNKFLLKEMLYENKKYCEKATIGNQYNQIPHPALDNKWERNTHILDGIK